MKIMTLCVITGLAVGLPFAAWAQGPASVAKRTGSSDVEYCSALSNTYNRYLNETIGQGATATSLEGRVAIENCRTNTKASISVLERKLSDAKIPLPLR